MMRHYGAKAAVLLLTIYQTLAFIIIPSSLPPSRSRRNTSCHATTDNNANDGNDKVESNILSSSKPAVSVSNVRDIILPSVAVEHKVNAGPFARSYPQTKF